MHWSLFFLFILSFNLKAQTVELDLALKSILSPASDLVFQGKSITSDEAMSLRKKGIDLSKLNPHLSDLFSNKALSIQTPLNYPQEDLPLFQFESFMTSPTEVFRSRVIHPKDTFILSTGLEAHAIVARAKLLRFLGYDVDIPKYYPKVKIQFKDESLKIKYLVELSNKTLTARSRWIIDQGKDWLLLKSMVLEPTDIKTNLYWGIMNAPLQKSRRTFRALLAPFLLTLYPEEVNEISWEVGRSFDNKLLLTHPYGDEFADTTLDDLKWILRKMVILSRQDWLDFFAESYYPQEIKELIVEKTLSRLSSLAEKAQLTKKEIALIPKANTKLTLGQVVNGKLTGFRHQDDFALHFYQKDPRSPFRLAEILRYFGNKLSYSALSFLIRKAQERYIPIDPKDALNSLDQQLKKQLDSDHKKDFFSAPYINGRFNANRKIVFGQFQGSNAPIQLVDSFSLEANLGLLARHSSNPKINPVMNIGGQVTRSYLHIKSMPDIQTATKQKLFNIYIPHVLKKLSKKIHKVTCSISPDPYMKESSVNGEPLYKIFFDKKLINGFKLALKLKKELIEQGYPANQILIEGIDRDEMCKEEVNDGVDQLINRFLEKFSEQETFIVNDEVRLNFGIKSVFSLDFPAKIGVSPRAETAKTFGRSFIIRKKADGFEVIYHKQRSQGIEAAYGINYFIKLFEQEFRWNKYKLNSQVFYINLKGKTLTEKLSALNTLKVLFSKRSKEIILENYKPTDINHVAKARHRVLRFLLWSNDRFQMKHDIKIKVRDQENKTHTRTFFSFVKASRNGKDRFDFAKQVVSDLFTKGLANSVLPSEQVDPGQSIAGTSKRFVILSEGETTSGQPLKQTSQLQWGFKGSTAKKKKLFRIFDDIEDLVSDFDDQIIDRGPYRQMKKLKTYDILASLILYPKAHEILASFLDEKNYPYNISKWMNLVGKEAFQGSYQESCSDRLKKDGLPCIPKILKKFFKLTKKYRKSHQKKKKMEALSKAIFKLFKKYPVSKILKIVGPKHFFLSAKISGFRTRDAQGYISTISDTVGNYDPIIGTGLLDYISKNLKISSFEIKGLKFAPGL